MKCFRTVGAVLLVVAVASVAVASAAFAADPDKPEWPNQFEIPFGLNVRFPSIKNASAVFHYNWDIEAQRIDYYEHCLPLMHWNAYKYPCAIYFVHAGIFLHQPGSGLDCCLVTPDVGAVPPNFLAPFNFSNVENVPNMFGESVSTNHWTGPDGFAYWTAVSNGDDVQFQDGPTGVLWNFGKFNMTAQDPAYFALPGTTDACSKKCGFLASTKFVPFASLGKRN